MKVPSPQPQRPAGACRGEPRAQRKAAAVAPGDDRVPAEDLFPGIVPLSEQLRGSSHIWFIGWWGIHLKGGVGEPEIGSAPDSVEHDLFETMGGEKRPGRGAAVSWSQPSASAAARCRLQGRRVDDPIDRSIP